MFKTFVFQDVAPNWDPVEEVTDLITKLSVGGQQCSSTAEEVTDLIVKLSVCEQQQSTTVQDIQEPTTESTLPGTEDEISSDVQPPDTPQDEVSSEDGSWWVHEQPLLFLK